MLGFGEVIEGSRRVSPAQLQLIRSFVRKYAEFLNAPVLPEVLIRDNLGAKWLGRTVWHASNPKTTKVFLQRSILSDPATLERVVAHEMIHHVEALEMTDAEIALVKLGLKPKSHGKRFVELADKINETMGKDFVTETSDNSHVVKSKNYSMLIRKLHDGRLGYAIGLRFSPKMKKVIETTLYAGGRLVQSSDPHWTHGPRIGEGWGVPVEPEDREQLRALFEQKAT